MRTRRQNGILFVFFHGSGLLTFKFGGMQRHVPSPSNRNADFTGAPALRLLLLAGCIGFEMRDTCRAHPGCYGISLFQLNGAFESRFGSAGLLHPLLQWPWALHTHQIPTPTLYCDSGPMHEPSMPVCMLFTMGRSALRSACNIPVSAWMWRARTMPCREWSVRLRPWLWRHRLSSPHSVVKAY